MTTKPYFANERSELLQFIPTDIKMVLDVGCGTGMFGKRLKEKFNCAVWGVEKDEFAATEAFNNIDNVINASFDCNIDFQGNKFDCIFFNDVLEHLIDPYSALNYAKKLLKPHGYIISSIPNVLHFANIWDILISMDWKYEQSGIMDETHLRFFTKKSINRTFEACGLNILTLEGINPSYGIKYKILNLLFCNKLNDMKYIQFVVVAQI